MKTEYTTGMNKLTSTKIIHLGIVVFWFFFWMLSFVDKIILTPTFLWVGKNFFDEFTELFSSIGISSTFVVSSFYWFVVLAELLAFILLALSLYFHLTHNLKKASTFFLSGTIVGLIIFGFFTLGDQVFGERSELLEHTIFWIALLVSWISYTYSPTHKT